MGWNPLIVHTAELSSTEQSEIFKELISVDDISAILFSDSLSASNLFLMSKNYLGVYELVPRLRKIRIGAIGPVTAHRLAELGVPETIIPETFIIDDALKELLS